MASDGAKVERQIQNRIFTSIL